MKHNKSLAVVLIILGSISPLGIDLYIPAIGTIGNYFDNPVAYLVSSYVLGTGLSQLIWGVLSDHYSRKTILLIGLTLFITSCLLMMVSHSTYSFYLLRFIQGVGGGGVMVSVFAIVRDNFEHKQKDIVYSQINGMMNVVPVLAPALGLFILQEFTWQYLFFATAVVAILYVLLATMFIKHPREHLLYSTNNLSKYRPLLNDNCFIYGCLIVGTSLGIIFAYLNLSYAVVVNIDHLSLKTYTQLFSGIGGVMIISGFVVSKLLDIFGRKTILLIGSLIMFVGASTWLYNLGNINTYTFMIPMIFIAIGFIFICGIAMGVALDKHGHNAGTASSILGSAQMIISAIIAGFISYLSVKSGLCAMSIFAYITILFAVILARIAT